MTERSEWFTKFKLTKDDINKIRDWLREQNNGLTLDEITRWYIRDKEQNPRVDTSATLPDWIHKKHVLSWDEVDKWCVGCQVLVADEVDDKITPLFGLVKGMTDTYFDIEINNKIECYDRPKKGSEAAKRYYEVISKSIWERELQLGDQTTLDNIEERVELILLKNGAEIASGLHSALENDKRFIFWEHHWYLRSWIKEIPKSKLRQAHKQIRRKTIKPSIAQLRSFISDLPEGVLGDLSLFMALSSAPDLFLPTEDGWVVVAPPSPPWNDAIGICYVYDPETYEILLNPDQQLTKKVADRLTELGFYAEVVEAKEDN